MDRRTFLLSTLGAASVPNLDPNFALAQSPLCTPLIGLGFIPVHYRIALVFGCEVAVAFGKDQAFRYIAGKLRSNEMPEIISKNAEIIAVFATEIGESAAGRVVRNSVRLVGDGLSRLINRCEECYLESSFRKYELVDDIRMEGNQLIEAAGDFSQNTLTAIPSVVSTAFVIVSAAERRFSETKGTDGQAWQKYVEAVSSTTSALRSYHSNWRSQVNYIGANSVGLLQTMNDDYRLKRSYFNRFDAS